MADPRSKASLADSSLIRLSTERLGGALRPGDLAALQPALAAAIASLRQRAGPGADALGWIDLPHHRAREQQDEHRRLLECARRLRGEIDTLVVIGIGGSYLGARAVLEASQHRLDYDAKRAKRPLGPRVVWAGHHLEGSYYHDLLEGLRGREVAVNVISKSGTTTEPAVAFRLLRRALEEQYGPQKARGRIVATTDARKGALRTLAGRMGYETFIVPDDVGGRFSVLTPVGLLPLAVAGVDVDALLAGAAAEAQRCAGADPANVADVTAIPAVRYAAARYVLSLQGFAVEVLASFHPSLHYVAEWWKQLFGESEGKRGRGLFPAALDFTTDLHSMGQYMQEGRRFLLETFLEVRGAPEGPAIPAQGEDLDGLEYLAGRPVGAVNAQALAAVAQAHGDGGVPSMTVTLPALEEAALGSLLYFFEYAVAVSGRLLGVNPFDQPGVEAYKTNLFRLLGKPGYGGRPGA